MKVSGLALVLDSKVADEILEENGKLKKACILKLAKQGMTNNKTNNDLSISYGKKCLVCTIF